MNETLKCDMCDQWNIKAGQKVFSCRARECMDEGGFDICAACGDLGGAADDLGGAADDLRDAADVPLEQPQPAASDADDLMPDAEPAARRADALMPDVEPEPAAMRAPPRASRRRADTGNRGGVAAAGPTEPEGGRHVETEPEAPGSATKAHEGRERIVRRRRSVAFSD